MDDRKIESVCAVATYRSYTEAAFRIASSPSVISKHITAVEDELGVRLFKRATKSAPVELTEEGEKLLPILHEIRRQYALAMETAGALQRDHKELLRVGYVQQIGSFRENSILAGYTIAHPEVIILRKTFSFQELASQLMNDAVDAVFLPIVDGAQSGDFARLQDGGYVITEIMHIDKLHLGVPHTHRFADRPELHAEDFSALAEETFLFPAAEVGGDRLSPLVSRKLGIPDLKVRYIDFSERILPGNIVMSGGGLLPQLCLVPESVAHMRFIPVEGGGTGITLYLAYKKSADRGALRKLNQYVISSSAQFYREFSFVTVPDGR